MEDRKAYYIGVDVGTGGVRAMLVSQSGHIVTIATHPLDTWEPATDFYEQSSDDIWSACCKTVQVGGTMAAIKLQPAKGKVPWERK